MTTASYLTISAITGGQRAEGRGQKAEGRGQTVLVPHVGSVWHCDIPQALCLLMIFTSQHPTVNCNSRLPCNCSGACLSACLSACLQLAFQLAFQLAYQARTAPLGLAVLTPYHCLLLIQLLLTCEHRASCRYPPPNLPLRLPPNPLIDQPLNYPGLPWDPPRTHPWTSHPPNLTHPRLSPARAAPTTESSYP